MLEIHDRLEQKLSEKFLTSIEMRRVIRDIASILDDPGASTVDSVNNRLRILGWHDQLVDRAILDLIIYLVEDEQYALTEWEDDASARTLASTNNRISFNALS